MFYKGTIVNNVQGISRTVVDDLSQAIQFGSGTAAEFYDLSPVTTYVYGAINVPVRAQCIGNIRYSYFLASKSLGSNITEQLPHILWKDELGSGAPCVPRNITLNNPGGIKGRELLGNAMRLVNFTINRPTGNNRSWYIGVTIAYGATSDVFDRNPDTTPNYNRCSSGALGGQFCAISPITTYVTRRL